MDKKFLATAATLAGTIIGAGILGLPYVFAQSGFLIGLFWLICLGAIMLFVNLCLGEVTLRTRGKHQLPGYAEKYLGKFAKKVMFFALIFGIYSALLAYLVGEGQSLSQLLPGNINPLFLGFGFWLVMTLLLREGLKGLKKVETYGVLAIILIIVGAFVYFFSQIIPSNLLVVNFPDFAAPFGILLFALMGFTSIPELRKEIYGEEKLFKKAIILGSLIPIILYVLFVITFMGVLGNSVEEVSTLSFGPLMVILGVFTMFTSYFVLSYSLRDTFKYDIKLSKRVRFFLISIVPLILYFLVNYFQIVGFSKILGIGGVVSGGLMGILILLINKKSKKMGKRKPEIKIPLNWLSIILLIIVFTAGVFLEFFH
ncbi:MAG: amino acid permease [archaeon]|nr:amino acid permease [archaeon]MCR4323653.1 amino acid permease [Nanoarchaeota archaeon]